MQSPDSSTFGQSPPRTVDRAECQRQKVGTSRSGQTGASPFFDPDQSYQSDALSQNYLPSSVGLTFGRDNFLVASELQRLDYEGKLFTERE